MSTEKFLNVIHRNTFIRGELDFPCVPSLLDLYMERLKTLFDTFGKSFSQPELDHLRSLLTGKLEEGFRVSPLSKLIIRYEPSQSPNTGISYTITYSIGSIADHYHSWAVNKQPPLFGTHADAKAIDVLSQFGDIHQVKALDIGAGTGRNTFALAKLGCTVEALEMTPAFVAQLQSQAEAENLPITAITGDILDPLVRLKPCAYHFILCSEVTSHFRDADQLRLLLAKACDYLQHGGFFLFNAFIADDDYEPSLLDRQMSEVAWSTIFTHQDLEKAFENLPIEMLEQTSVLDFERAHLPAEAWPPTGWFENWASGRDAFSSEEKPPMQLYWILCKRL